MAVMFTVITPSAALKAIAAPFVVGVPGVVKPFHVAPDSVQPSVSWRSIWAPPGFVISNCRNADTTTDPGATCPASDPMMFGNRIRALHTVLGDVLHPDASTNIAPPAPKFVSGRPLEMYVSSVSLWDPPSPFWSVRVTGPEGGGRGEMVQRTACDNPLALAVLEPTTRPASLRS